MLGMAGQGKARKRAGCVGVGCRQGGRGKGGKKKKERKEYIGKWMFVCLFAFLSFVCVYNYS